MFHAAIQVHPSVPFLIKLSNIIESTVEVTKACYKEACEIAIKCDKVLSVDTDPTKAGYLSKIEQIKVYRPENPTRSKSPALKQNYTVP